MTTAEFGESLAGMISVLLTLIVVLFLAYGMLKGIVLEKEHRLRNKRRYS